MLESKNIIPLQVSKWVKIPLLVDAHEMRNLIDILPPFQIYDVQKTTSKNEGIYEPTFFLEKYTAYVSALKRGEVPEQSEYRSIFSAVWSVTQEALFSIPIHHEKRLLKSAQPVVQSQMNLIRYSKEENTFRTQVFAADSIFWGIQLGFPHIFLNPHTYEASTTREFPNMALFLAIQRWVRHNTCPTPFIINNMRFNSPIRLGKECFFWISSHPQLLQQGISIDCS